MLFVLSNQFTESQQNGGSSITLSEMEKRCFLSYENSTLYSGSIGIVKLELLQGQKDGMFLFVVNNTTTRPLPRTLPDTLYSINCPGSLEQNKHTNNKLYSRGGRINRLKWTYKCTKSHDKQK